MNVVPNGLITYAFDKYGDEIVISKPNLQIMNLIFGTKYLDLNGTAKAINKTNGM